MEPLNSLHSSLLGPPGPWPSHSATCQAGRDASNLLLKQCSSSCVKEGGEAKPLHSLQSCTNPSPTCCPLQAKSNGPSLRSSTCQRATRLSMTWGTPLPALQSPGTPQPGPASNIQSPDSDPRSPASSPLPLVNTPLLHAQTRRILKNVREKLMKLKNCAAAADAPSAVCQIYKAARPS
jgi:hypothetical protein